MINNPPGRKQAWKKYSHTPAQRAARAKYRKSPLGKATKERLILANPIHHMLKNCKRRAKKNNIPFDITSMDIEKPTHCPVFDIPLNYIGTRIKNNKSLLATNTATLDRIVPSLGYVKGNVIVISWRANELKRNATVDELVALASFYQKLLGHPN